MDARHYFGELSKRFYDVARPDFVTYEMPCSSQTVSTLQTGN